MRRRVRIAFLQRVLRGAGSEKGAAGEEDWSIPVASFATSSVSSSGRKAARELFANLCTVDGEAAVRSWCRQFSRKTLPPDAPPQELLDEKSFADFMVQATAWSRTEVLSAFDVLDSNADGLVEFDALLLLMRLLAAVAASKQLPFLESYGQQLFDLLVASESARAEGKDEEEPLYSSRSARSTRSACSSTHDALLLMADGAAGGSGSGGSAGEDAAGGKECEGSSTSSATLLLVGTAGVAGQATVRVRTMKRAGYMLGEAEESLSLSLLAFGLSAGDVVSLPAFQDFFFYVFHSDGLRRDADAMMVKRTSSIDERRRAPCALL
eukprot:PLAT3574.1.p1 GENE.PLAT3574.1~~PLAT3574.1.p1  ORF type:complete len:324 (-),score=116.90 PLAT3574.1:436-1407(-)